MQTADVNSPGEEIRPELLTVLTTEHFTLQGARGSTVSESSARAALYVGALSSALVALGFLGQASEFGGSFDAFALVVLPTLYALGVFTFARLVTSSIEDLLYGRAINRIRNYYRDIAGSEARYLLLGGNDDVQGVLENMGVRNPSRWQLFFTLASMVAVLNSIVGGTTVALVAGKLLGAPIGVAVLAGGVVALASLQGHIRLQRRMHDAAREGTETLFPSGE
jgi:hypothetical protein